MNKILDLRFTLFFMIIFVFTACDNSNHKKTSNSNAVNGYAQKGPFKKGSNVKAFKLVNGEKSTTFIETKVDDNKGTYNLDIPWVGPTLIEISGEYFNETDGTYIQNGFLTSIVNIKENQKQNSNVNILTHLASKNIMKELKNNSSSIDEVIKTSDKKVANLFNLDLHEKNLKDLDLTNNKDEEIKKANAQLLKISAAILSTSNPKETLEKITEDFEEDGEINNAVDEFNELKQKEAQINLDEISSTMKNNLGLEDIPTNEVLEGTLSLNNNISFINLADVKPNTIVESNTITVEGVNLEAQISIENGEFQVDNEVFSSDTSTIKNGQTLKIRHTSANEFDKTKTTIVKIAGIEFKFTSTTQENTSKVINISEAQYSTKEKTNKDVKVTFVSDDDLTVPSTWQKQSNEYFKIYTENTNEKVVVFEDKFGNSVEKTISISNIDKTAPILNQAQYSTKTLTNTSVVVTFTSESTDIVTPSGWDKNENSFSKVYLNNQVEEVSFSDDVGNITKKQIVISNIDKTAPTASVEYSTSENTNEDVIVTITLSEDVIDLTNNSWKKEGKVFTKTFSSSGNETITFTDLAGNTVEKTVSISNIDKSELSAQVVGISSTPTNQDVTVTLNFNKDIKTAQESWNKISNRSYSKVFTQNSTETVNFTDISNNIFTKQIVISNIDKTAPTASIEYSTIENTNEDVIVTITLSEDVIDLTNNSWKKEGKVFTKTFSSSGNETITFTDLAGNTVEKTVSISNIDKSELSAQVVGISSTPTNQDVTVTLNFNKDIKTAQESWNKISNRSYSKVFTQNSTETVNFTDISNNIFTKQIVISNIDKTAPTASIEYSTIENTNEDVIVTITLSEDVIDLTDNSWKKEGKVFTKTFSSNASETITFTDLAGNTVEKTVSISNIDKSALNITSISPSNNSENIDIKTKFVVLFNKELATLEQNDIELLDALDNVISTNIVVTNNKVEIISDSDLEYLKVYKLKISSNIKDISNNSLSQEQTYTFKTTKKSGTHYDANGLVYNEIVSPRTGSIWLDRNLGASAVCTTKDDANCIGDFFQWGRLMNGHEKRNSEVSVTRIDVDSQENNKFIKANGYGTSSWSNNTDETLWSGVNASNNICPEGFKVPSIDELKAELFSLNDSFDSEFLKIPNSSYRQTNSGEIYSNISSSNNTQLYSSTLLNNNINPQAKALKYDSYKSKYVLEEKDLRSGLNVRCIKDYTDDTLPEILEIKTGNNILSNNQTEIDVNDNITVKFSEFLKEDTLTSDNINLTKDDNILGFKSSFIKNGNEVIFTSTLSYGSSYTLHINTNIEDISGNKLKEEKIIKFTTENEPDTTPVKLDSNKSSLGVSLSDSRNVGISIKNNIEIYFNEPIDISTLTKENFVIENANYNLELDNTKQKVTISFNADLNYNTRYNLLLKKEILDLSGNGFDGSGYGYGTSNKEIPFTTQDVPDTKAPSIISTSVNDGDSNISVSKSLLITFDEEVKDYDNSAIVLKEFNTNTIVNTTNTYLDKVVTVKPNSTLSENTLYKLIVNTNIKDTSDNALETDYEISFTTGSSISCDGEIINDICYKVSTEKKSWEEVKNNCELQNKTLVQKDSVSDFVELANTLNLNTNESYWLYEGKSGTYKQATYLRYNQWSNPAWSTTTGYNDSTYYYICKSDKVSPIATLEKPTSLADVSTKAKFEIVFNEDVKNIDTSSIELTNSSNELIPLTVSYENKILTIQANSDLNISSTYTITLKNTITDFYNNALEEKTFSFTTSSVASNCDGAEIDGKCYTLVSEEKTYNEANAHCTLLSKDTSVDLTNLATQLNLKDKDTSYNPIYYWLKEKDSWGYGHTLYKGYSGWSTTSTKAASSNYQFICVE